MGIAGFHERRRHPKPVRIANPAYGTDPERPRVYRTICTELWTDPKVRQLATETKLVFMYLLTCPRTHVSGIYHLPLRDIVAETGLSDRVSRVGLDTLSEKAVELAFYDWDGMVVWIVNMFAYQGQGPKTERAAATHLLTLHHSPLIGRFLNRYPNVKAAMDDEDPVKRQSLPSALRFEILARDGFKCTYCGQSAGRRWLEVDHIIPLSAGGTNDRANLRTSCVQCNVGKGDTLSKIGDTPSAVGPPVPVPVLLSVPKRGIRGNTRASEFPKDWILTDEQHQQAVLLGLNAPQEFAKFRDYHTARGTRFKDWSAAWRNWTRKAEELKHALPKML